MAIPDRYPHGILDSPIADFTFRVNKKQTPAETASLWTAQARQWRNQTAQAVDTLTKAAKTPA